MSWQTPKTDWMPGDVVGDADLNRIEGNLAMCGPAVVEAAGDLLVGAGPHQLARLPVGAEGQVLAVQSGAPAWVYLAADDYLAMWGL
jgi:hypothetical protein